MLDISVESPAEPRWLLKTSSWPHTSESPDNLKSGGPLGSVLLQASRLPSLGLGFYLS